jgi:hypothetical protein
MNSSFLKHALRVRVTFCIRLLRILVAPQWNKRFLNYIIVQVVKNVVFMAT